MEKCKNNLAGGNSRTFANLPSYILFLPFIRRTNWYFPGPSGNLLLAISAICSYNLQPWEKKGGSLEKLEILSDPEKMRREREGSKKWTFFFCYCLSFIGRKSCLMVQAFNRVKFKLKYKAFMNVNVYYIVIHQNWDMHTCRK